MNEKLPPSILVIEADEIRRTSISNNIERYGFTVIRSDGTKNLSTAINVHKPNVIIIADKLGEKTTEEHVEEIRKNRKFGGVPLLFIVDDESKLKNNQEDDGEYVTDTLYKNFSPNELMTSIKSMLRRSRPVLQDRIIKYKNLEMDLSTFRVKRENKSVHLGPTEFKILKLLASAPRTILSRQEIIDFVWDDKENIEKRTVDVHVNRLRSLLRVKENEPPFIKTVRAAGYCLSLPGEID